jgi:hypothetical protein
MNDDQARELDETLEKLTKHAIEAFQKSIYDPRVPVSAARKSELDVERARRNWGENWRDDSIERPCSVCGETCILRKTYERSETIICKGCTPAYIEALQGKYAGNA